MAAHDAVDRGRRHPVELGGAKRHAAVRRGGDLRVRPEGNLDHAGVEQGQQLLGAQRRRPGLEPVDPTPDVRLEVDVRLERQPAELDDRAQLVAQDPQHLLGRLDRAAAHGQRLVEVGLDHVVDLGLVVPARRVVATGAGEDVAWPGRSGRTAVSSCATASS